MKIRNIKTGFEYSSNTLVYNSKFGDYYDPAIPAIEVYREFGSITIRFPSEEWEVVDEQLT